MSVSKINQGDTAEPWTDVLKYNGAVINLTGASVVLRISARGASGPYGDVVERAATIVSAAAGTVSYQPVLADVATVGKYALEWVVTFSDDTELSVPSSGFISLDVAPLIGFEAVTTDDLFTIPGDSGYYGTGNGRVTVASDIDAFMRAADAAAARVALGVTDAPTLTQEPFSLGVPWNDNGLTRQSLATAAIEQRFEINSSFGSSAAPVGVYTDAAGTTAATSAGDVVKCLKDPASGATLAQATTGNAPTLEVYDGRWVLRFTSTQYLSNSATSISAANVDIWLVARIRSAATAGPAMVTAAAAGEDAFNSVKSFRLDADDFSNNLIVRGTLTAMRCVYAQNRSGTLAVFLDGQQIGTSAVNSEAMTGVSTRLYLNALARSNGSVWDGDGCNMDVEALYISHSTAASAAAVVSKYLTRDPNAVRVVFDGDSLTDTSEGTSFVSVGEEYPSVYQQRNPLRLVLNRAVFGERISNIVNRQTEVSGFARAGSVYCLLVGRNDLAAGVTGASLYASTSANCLAMAAAGYARIYVGTQIPEAINGSGTRPAWESERLAFNTLLRAGYRDFCTGIIDFDADARLSDPTNTTYFFPDRLHQTAAGCRVKAEMADAVIRF